MSANIAQLGENVGAGYDFFKHTTMTQLRRPPLKKGG